MYIYTANYITGKIFLCIHRTYLPLKLIVTIFDNLSTFINIPVVLLTAQLNENVTCCKSVEVTISFFSPFTLRISVPAKLLIMYTQSYSLF